MKEYLVKYSKYLINILIWIIGASLAVKLLPKAAGMMLPFILGWLVAMIANPLVKILESKIKLKRKAGSMLIIVAVLSLMVLIIYMGLTKLLGEALAFASQLPNSYTGLAAEFTKVKAGLVGLLENLPPDLRTTITDISSDAVSVIANLLEKSGKTLVETTAGLAKSIPSLFIAFIITIISSYFMLAQKEEISAILKRKVSAKTRKRFETYSQGVNKIIGGYFKAQLKLLGIVGAILFVGFLALGTNYALLFSVLIALLDFLPFFGTGTALGPWAILSALSGDYSLAVGLIIIYIITQLARRVLEPKILGDTIGMNPLLTLILMYVGYKALGVWGLIFSAPLGMLAINIYQQGAFDNLLFIFKDIWNDLSKLKNIEEYKKIEK